MVIGLLVGGGLTVILFLIWEYRQGDAAMIPLAMLRTTIIWSAAATLFFLLGAILAAEYYLAMYFQTVHGNSARDEWCTHSAHHDKLALVYHCFWRDE